MLKKSPIEEKQNNIEAPQDIMLSKLQELEAKIALYDQKLKSLDEKELSVKSSSIPKTDKEKSNLELKAKLKVNREKDREMVKGMFKFYEIPGGNLSFVYRKYTEDPVEKFSLNDGEVYTLPLGVAKHLNSSGWYPKHQYKNTEKGYQVRIGEKIHRYGFQSLDFVDMEELYPQREIVTVEHGLK